MTSGSKGLTLSLGLGLSFNKRRKYVLVIDGFKEPFPLVMEIPTGWYIKKEGDDALVGMSGKIVAQMVKGEKPCIDISCLKLDRTPIKECIAI